MHPEVFCLALATWQAAAMHRMAKEVDGEDSFAELLEGYAAAQAGAMPAPAGCAEGVLVALADALLGSKECMQVCICILCDTASVYVRLDAWVQVRGCVCLCEQLGIGKR